MTGRLKLTHLTLVGSNIAPTSVSFGQNLTVIHGPSNTGKSFIVDAIDYALGASKLKTIPECEGYSHILLGLLLPGGESVTLSRPLNGGRVLLYNRDLRVQPISPPDTVLNEKHSAGDFNNVSNFLLRQIGLSDKRVRKNAQNKTNSLSFRDVLRICLIDETQMQAEYPPGYSSNVTTRTKESSVLKLILMGEDDSELTSVESPQQQKKLRGAKRAVVEKMIESLQDQIDDASSKELLEAQLGKVDRSIDARSDELGNLIAERSKVIGELTELQLQINNSRKEFSEASALEHRFMLLERQYSSDLERLEMISEAGNLLAYFQPGTCVFCGAEESAQHYNRECDGDTTSFGVSVASEFRKTQGLLDDLRETIQNLRERVNFLKKSIDRQRNTASEAQSKINDLDEQLTPGNQQLRELITRRSEIENQIRLYYRVDELESLLRNIENETDEKVSTPTNEISLTVTRKFSNNLVALLTRWGYPDADLVRYDRESRDMFAGDQPRAAHGKGARAVMHAAFALALAQHCTNEGLAHPGFVVLDSPLVTYRPPDIPEYAVDEPPTDFVRAFYKDLENQFKVQVIVIENSDPVEPLGNGAKDIQFTKLPNTGRYGFFARPSL